MPTDTDRARPHFARLYMRTAERADQRGGAEHRCRLLEGLHGTVVEIGPGHGANFAYYPTGVTEVIAVEPEPTLREAAIAAASRAPIPIRVMAGSADRIPTEDGTADAAVASLVLCSVPSQARALAELRRVLRADGELRFYEHVVADSQPKRFLLQALDRSGIWSAVAGGCHPARDTTSAIEEAGFEIVRCERFMFATSRLEPSIPYILGSARVSS
jgi:SAM-dependent methyltransferase